MTIDFYFYFHTFFFSRFPVPNETRARRRKTTSENSLRAPSNRARISRRSSFDDKIVVVAFRVYVVSSLRRGDKRTIKKKKRRNRSDSRNGFVGSTRRARSNTSTFERVFVITEDMLRSTDGFQGAGF